MYEWERELGAFVLWTSKREAASCEILYGGGKEIVLTVTFVLTVIKF